MDPSFIKRKKILVTVDDEGNPLHVHPRALSMHDIGIVYGEDDDAFTALFEGFFGEQSGDEMMRFIILRLPAVAALIMALACDQPDEVENFSRLPFAKQVEILKAIYELTSPDEYAKKNSIKGMEMIVAMLMKSGLISSNQSAESKD